MAAVPYGDASYHLMGTPGEPTEHFVRPVRNQGLAEHLTVDHDSGVGSKARFTGHHNRVQFGERKPLHHG
jgi:hypothetical protein|tara:strand:+ start:3279 stop:3488 length:210 start_codon:yes stop_codon:yes gene_type:complete